MMPQTKVFVGRVPPGSRPEDLRKLFERFGTVTECDILNRCGFVHMESEEQATAAIEALNNTTFNGGSITVERGRMKERGGGMRGTMRGGMRGGPMRGGPASARDAPYMRDGRLMPMRDMRFARNGMGAPPPYARGMERLGGYDERYGGYGGEDRRGFALMDRREQYMAPPPMYDERHAFGCVIEMTLYEEHHVPMYEEHRAPMYDDRRAPMYDGRQVMDRRALRPLPAATDMYPHHSMRGAPATGYNRDPYATHPHVQQYPPIGR